MSEAPPGYRVEVPTQAGALGTPGVAVHETTGERVLLPEGQARRAKSWETVRLRHAAAALAALEDPRFFPIRSTRPVAIVEPPGLAEARYFARTADFEPTLEDAIDGVIEAVELAAIANRCGVTIRRIHVSLTRDGGRSSARALAPMTGWRDPRWLREPMELLCDLFGWRPDVTGLLPRPPRVTSPIPAELAEVVRTWRASGQGDGHWDDPFPVDVDGMLDALARYASPHTRIAEARAAGRAAAGAPDIARGVWLDELITLGEAELREYDGTEWTYLGAMLSLGALWHRRACFRAEANDLDRARADVGRAIELDPHPEHHTTLALLEERRGNDDAARVAHDAAVLAIDVVRPKPDGAQRASMDDPDWRAGMDYRESWPMKVARTLLSRGVFRLRHGDAAGARADLLASLAAHETEEARRALARCG